MFALMSASVGETMAPKDFQRSRCGEEFDEYVFQALDPFPWSFVGAASREVTDLWRGRRLKLHCNGAWREGKVCGWTQFNPDSTTNETKWNLELELDTLQVGDVVNMSVSGAICNAGRGACVIQVPREGEVKAIAIRPGNVKLPCMKLQVNRMNVEGGGTLKVIGDENTPLISLEWLESASPSINLNAGILSFDCPCCRAAEPVLVACEAPALMKKDDCPVCLETKECRVLECGHGVCHACWSSCRKAAMYGSIELEDLDLEEIQKERAERYRLFKKKRTRGSARDETLKHRFAATVGEIAEEVRRDEQGLVRLKREFMVEHPSLWVSEKSSLFDDLSIAGCKIVLQVIEERMDEIQETATDDVHNTTFYLCFLIAGRYAQASNYFAAVPWAELSLFYVKQIAKKDREHLSVGYQFAAQAQRDADFLSKSMKSYDASLVVLSENDKARQEQQSLLLQMEQWTGSSGKLTPGC